MSLSRSSLSFLSLFTSLISTHSHSIHISISFLSQAWILWELTQYSLAACDTAMPSFFTASSIFSLSSSGTLLYGGLIYLYLLRNIISSIRVYLSSLYILILLYTLSKYMGTCQMFILKLQKKELREKLNHILRLRDYRSEHKRLLYLMVLIHIRLPMD